MPSIIPMSLSSLLVVSLFLTGCNSGQDRTASTSTAAADTLTAIRGSGVHIDGLIQSLTNLRAVAPQADPAAPGTDLKALYSAFAADGDAVTKDIAAVGNGADATERKGRAQLAEWNKQTATIQDAELRAATAKRSSELRIAIEALAASNVKSKYTGKGFSTQIADIRKALDADLTIGGIAALKPSITKVIDSTAGLREAFADVEAKTTAVVNMLSTK